MTEQTAPFIVYGMTQSFFTRKITGYLDYKNIPWRLSRSGGNNPQARAAGYPGGIPAVKTPGGEFMWDSTPVIHYLENLFPQPAVLPPDPVQRFLCYILEDFADEWLYRLAVGSRWYFEENKKHGGFELARELTYNAPLTCDQAHALVTAAMLSSCEPFGVNGENAQAWMDEMLKPWFHVLGAHLEKHPFLFGHRPSLADFAIYGGNAAHFTNDPVCRRWLDAEGPAGVQHTHRLTEPWNYEFGNWLAADDIPHTLINLLADLGRFYLPWVSRGVKEGSAPLDFEDGPSTMIKATEFIKDARRVLLARYKEHRSEALDDILNQADILEFFADHIDQAGTIPDPRSMPRPADNRPFPTTLSEEEILNLLMDLGADPTKMLPDDN